MGGGGGGFIMNKGMSKPLFMYFGKVYSLTGIVVVVNVDKSL